METPTKTEVTVSVTEPPEIAALEKACTAKQAAFARYAVEYAQQGRAYRMAYDKWDATGNWVHQEAHRLMQLPHVVALHGAYLRWHRLRHAATIDGIIAKVQAIADADPADLIEHKIGCCRHCHGVDFKYQRTQAEYDRVWAEYAAAVMLPRKRGQKPPAEPDDLGGIGYNLTLDPHPACPECGGEGVGRTVIKDTRRLSPGAAALYAGVKETKDGTQVLMHNQLDAADKILRKLGAYVERKEISGPNGAALPVLQLSTTDPIEAARAYREMMGGAAP